MTHSFRLASIAMLIMALSSVASAQTQSFTVNCAKGQTIAETLEKGDARKPIVVIVRGTCNESVAVRRDDVTLRGDPSVGGTINGVSTADTLAITGTRVLIDSLTLTGGANGLGIYGVHIVDVTNSTVRGARLNGVLVRNGHASVVNSTIESSGASGVLLSAATARLQGNRVQYSAGAGVFLTGRSHTASNGNTISSNAGVGIHAEQKSDAIVQNNTIRSNGSDGVSIYSDSYAKIQGSTITANGTNPALSGNGVSVNQSNAEIYNGNSITDHPCAGMAASLSQVQVSYSTISRNRDGGLGAYLGSVLVVTGGTISDNTGSGVSYSANSTGQIVGVAINNNTSHGIGLFFGSKLQIGSPASNVTGNGGFGLECADAESSVIDTAWLIGTVSPACTGY